MSTVVFIVAALLVGLILGNLVHFLAVRAIGSKTISAASKFKIDAEREAERLLGLPPRATSSKSRRTLKMK